MPIEWSEIDARVALAVESLEAAARELRRTGEPTPCPLEMHREVSTRSAYLELSEAGGGEWAECVARWVLSLTIERVTWADRCRLEAAWCRPPKPRSPRDVRRAPRDALAALLRDAGRAGHRAAHRDALVEGSPEASDAVRILAERRAEALRRMGAKGALEETEEAMGDVRGAATRFLDDTEGMIEPTGSTWDGVLPALLALDATEGWPAALTLRWVTGLFRRSPLLEGIALPPIDVPQAVGASSFALALARFGHALALASQPRSAPFALRRPCLDARGARQGALFASLIADPSFSRAALGLSRHRAAEQARVVARGLLLDARMRAARVLLDGVTTQPHDERVTLGEGWTRRAWGAPVPGALLGLVPRLESADALSFAGVLLGLSDRTRMVERYDEDWFRNPSAARALREDVTLPATRRGCAVLVEGELDRAVPRGVAFFAEMLA